VLVALVLPFLIILLAEHLRTDHHVVKSDRARIDHTRTHHARRRTAEPLPRFRQA
jgi:hypothetical protein